MKAIAIAALFALAASVAGAAPAAAPSPIFASATAEVNQSGFLYTTFKEVNLTGTSVRYLFQADVTATYSCLLNGYASRKASPPTEDVKQEALQNTVEMTVPNNGKLGGGIALVPIPTDGQEAACTSSGGTYHLVKVSYSQIHLWDTSNNIEADFTSGACASGACTMFLPGK